MRDISGNFHRVLPICRLIIYYTGIVNHLTDIRKSKLLNVIVQDVSILSRRFLFIDRFKANLKKKERKRKEKMSLQEISTPELNQCSKIGVSFSHGEKKYRRQYREHPI